MCHYILIGLGSFQHRQTCQCGHLDLGVREWTLHPGPKTFENEKKLFFVFKALPKRNPKPIESHPHWILWKEKKTSEKKKNFAAVLKPRVPRGPCFFSFIAIRGFAMLRCFGRSWGASSTQEGRQGRKGRRGAGDADSQARRCDGERGEGTNEKSS